MRTMLWYRARIRWAEMVEGRGIRHWEEGLYWDSAKILKKADIENASV